MEAVHPFDGGAARLAQDTPSAPLRAVHPEPFDKLRINCAVHPSTPLRYAQDERSVIAGATSVEQVELNVKAGAAVLTPCDFAEIESVLCGGDSSPLCSSGGAEPAPPSPSGDARRAAALTH